MSYHSLTGLRIHVLIYSFNKPCAGPRQSAKKELPAWPPGFGPVVSDTNPTPQYTRHTHTHARTHAMPSPGWEDQRVSPSVSW